MEPTTEETTAPLQLVPTNEAATAPDEQQAMAIAAIESQVAPVEVELAPGVVVDGPGAEKLKTVLDQIKDLNEQLEQLEHQRDKTVVEELVVEPEQLAAVAMIRRKERFPAALKSVETHLKQLAWSGERIAYLEPTTPIFNEKLVKHLREIGFKCSTVVMGATKEQKIKVEW